MIVYQLTALDKHPQTGAPLPPQPGACLSFCVAFPGDVSQMSQAQLLQHSQQAAQYIRAQKWGTPDKCIYSIGVAPPNKVTFLCAFFGYPGTGPQLSGAHVQGGQAAGAPIGQPNQNRPAGAIDKSGFQILGDADLGGASDTMFGPGDDGTVTDLFQGGHGSIEIPRQQ